MGPKPTRSFDRVPRPQPARAEIAPLENRLLLAALPASPDAAAAHASGGGAGLNPLSALPALNSYPSATAKLFLDFDGAPGENWNGTLVPDTPAYDTDRDPTAFSDSELADIRQIWARVAEKYAPFKVNVTTVDPGAYLNRQAFRVVIGGDGAWYTPPSGGAAWIGSYYNSLPNTAYVFSKSLYTPKNIGEAAAHEAGHAFGLQHQSEWDAGGGLVRRR